MTAKYTVVSKLYFGSEEQFLYLDFKEALINTLSRLLRCRLSQRKTIGARPALILNNLFITWLQIVRRL